MKLHRFIATTTQKAMLKISQELGPEALIYSTRSIDGGVEIVAGLPHYFEAEDKRPSDTRPFVEQNQVAKKQLVEALTTNKQSEQKGSLRFEFDDFEFPVHENQNRLEKESDHSIDKLQEKVRLIDERMKQLSLHVDDRFSDNLIITDDNHAITRNHLSYYLGKLGFRGAFCLKFINDYLWANQSYGFVDEDDVNSEILAQILTEQNEFIDQKNIIALVGPTGVGKTTTIAKLAKRYAARYGTESIGLITTDYQDTTVKNQLIYYSNTFNIDLEFANNSTELTYALKALKKKKLILIDTHGVGQRDVGRASELIDMLESQAEVISTYLTLPCNVQEPILDQIVRVFQSSTVRGCILTKKDESISIAPAVGTSINYNLPIAYVCDGQDITRDIHFASKDSILFDILSEVEITKNKQSKKNVRFNHQNAINQDDYRYERR